ncbi:glycosyltransferase [Oceanobacillus kimchii]|uniref:glycosyltransferase n=1 Tax=Oceanobacillus kimchii TaxID=746691 RepID=UPI003B018D98
MVHRKKVVFFIYQMGSGGAARTMLNILNNIDLEAFEPVLVTCNYNGDYEKYLNEEIKFIKLPTKRLRSAILPLSKIIRDEKADIVFSTIPNYNIVAILARLLSFTKAKNIVREAAFLGGSKKMEVKLKIYGLFYLFAKKVVALSNGVKENIIEQYKVPSNKVCVIYNPVDIEGIELQTNINLLSKEHQSIFWGENKVVITAGRFVDDKDHITLIYAFQKLQEKVKANLVILGEGELEEKLTSLVKQLKIEDKVYFIGFQENPYVYFHHSDVFALTSKREGFGHVLTEALATGVPVVSTRAKPGAEEVLDSGKYGLLIEVGDIDALTSNLEKVLQWDEHQKKEVTELGLKRVKEFQASKIVKQYEQLFKETIDD